MQSKTAPNRSLSGSLNPKPKTQNPKSSYWLPPILWMAAIFFFSTDGFSGQNTGSVLFNVVHRFFLNVTPEQLAPLHHFIRKTAHFTEYAILALLLFRAFRGGALSSWRSKWAVQALMLVAIYALLDEYHQTFTRTRGGSVYDSLIDFSGALTAMIFLWWKRRNQEG